MFESSKVFVRIKNLREIVNSSQWKIAVLLYQVLMKMKIIVKTESTNFFSVQVFFVPTPNGANSNFGITTGRQSNRQTNEEISKRANRKTNVKSSEQTERLLNRQTNIQIHKHTVKRTNRQTNEKQINIQTTSQTYR